MLALKKMIEKSLLDKLEEQKSALKYEVEKKEEDLKQIFAELKTEESAVKDMLEKEYLIGETLEGRLQRKIDSIEV